jgi:hypothetical protein
LSAALSLFALHLSAALLGTALWLLSLPGLRSLSPTLGLLATLVRLLTAALALSALLSVPFARLLLPLCTG